MAARSLVVAHRRANSTTGHTVQQAQKPDGQTGSPPSPGGWSVSADTVVCVIISISFGGLYFGFPSASHELQRKVDSLATRYERAAWLTGTPAAWSLNHDMSLEPKDLNSKAEWADWVEALFPGGIATRPDIRSEVSRALKQYQRDHPAVTKAGAEIDVKGELATAMAQHRQETTAAKDGMLRTLQDHCAEVAKRMLDVESSVNCNDCAITQLERRVEGLGPDKTAKWVYGQAD